MAQFTKKQLLNFLNKLKSNEMDSDALVMGEISAVTLLQAVILSDLETAEKVNYINVYAGFGCSPDTYGAFATAISMAASNGEYKAVINALLSFHQKGDRSDLDILKASAGSVDELMFIKILKSPKIDVNVTRMRGDHILHFLADGVGYADHIKDICELRPEVNRNPLNRKGLSPLTIALNNNIAENAKVLSIFGSKIIGDLKNWQLALDLGLSSHYDGDFLSDFPEALSYAVENHLYYIIPDELKQMFFIN